MTTPWDIPGLERRTDGFDFLIGTWAVTSRRLSEPLRAESDWHTTSATARAGTLHNGSISVDEMWFADEGFAGSSLRLHDPADDAWTIYWVNSRTGRLQSPVVGRWSVDGRTFVATGPDEFNGVPILARYTWHSITDDGAVWEQDFSTDDGLRWQTNWIMEWHRSAQ